METALKFLSELSQLDSVQDELFAAAGLNEEKPNDVKRKRKVVSEAKDVSSDDDFPPDTQMGILLDSLKRTNSDRPAKKAKIQQRDPRKEVNNLLKKQLRDEEKATNANINLDFKLPPFLTERRQLSNKYFISMH